MPAQEEHDKPENLVDQPGQAEHAARTLGQAADSNHTVQGYYAVNNVKDSAAIESEASQQEADPKQENGHPIP